MFVHCIVYLFIVIKLIETPEIEFVTRTDTLITIIKLLISFSVLNLYHRMKYDNDYDLSLNQQKD